MAKRYIRLTTERMAWSNTVAKYAGIEHEAGTHTPRMYGFKGVQGITRYVPENEMRFINAKEYFAEVLKGNEFNEHDG